jgi:class 3 adenylate cyclase
LGRTLLPRTRRATITSIPDAPGVRVRTRGQSGTRLRPGLRSASVVLDHGRPPRVQYVRSTAGALAYQVWGDGADLLLMTDFTTSVDNIWEHPGRIRLLSYLGTLGRVVRFDPRGQGASDPLPIDELGSLDAWVEDALTVLDHLDIHQVALSAEGFASHAAIAMALRQPQRVSRLALLNAFATLADDGQGVRASAERVARMVQERWGLGEISAMAGPTLAEGAPDPEFLERTERLGASPMVAAAYARAQWEADITDLLPRVDVPVLVVHTGDLALVSVEHSRFVAGLIPGARMVRAPSMSFYWSDSGFDEYAEFLTGRATQQADPDIATVLFTDIVDSTSSVARVGDHRWQQTLTDLDQFVDFEVARVGGRVVKRTGDGHLAVFARPRSALSAALAIIASAPTLNVRVRAGVHTGEIENRPDGDIAGIAVHIASRVTGQAPSQEVWVSRTVADLLAGADVRFEDRGGHSLKGLPEAWRLYRAQAR